METLRAYLDIDADEARRQWCLILARDVTLSGGRQEKFRPIEVVLCFGLFRIVDPRRFGGRRPRTLLLHVDAADSTVGRQQQRRSAAARPNCLASSLALGGDANAVTCDAAPGLRPRLITSICIEAPLARGVGAIQRIHALCVALPSTRDGCE